VHAVNGYGVSGEPIVHPAWSGRQRLPGQGAALVSGAGPAGRKVIVERKAWTRRIPARSTRSRSISPWAMPRRVAAVYS